MRNPFRRKNLRARFALWFALGALILYASSPTSLSLALGSIPIAVGLGLRAWGVGHLLKNGELTITGPYAHLRHPLYAGTLAIGIGFALGVGGLFAPAVCAGLLAWFFGSYFPRKDRSEGARLESLYGAAYTAYRERVPALWPRFRRRETAAGPGRGWSLGRFSENNELGTELAVLAGWGLLAFRLSVASA